MDNRPKPSINKFKRVFLEMYKWYPQYTCVGDLEEEFGKKEGRRMMNKLEEDGLIQGIAYNDEDDEFYYELTPRGLDFVNSIINLEYGKKIIFYSENMRKLTVWIIFLSIFTTGLSLIQFFYLFW